MESEQQITPLNTFPFEGHDHQILYAETTQVTDGVECDVYSFQNDQSKDLGIIRMKPGAKTPLQRVLQGDRTVEGHVSGKGQLTITRPDGQQLVYKVGEDPQQQLAVDVKVGDIMQWESAPDSSLTAYEVCFPPYIDGRYENIEEKNHEI